MREIKISDLSSNCLDMPSKFAEVLNKEFWNLIDYENPKLLEAENEI